MSHHAMLLITSTPVEVLKAEVLVYLGCRKGHGQISAIGGSGRGGASGGRIAISSMRIDGVTVRYHGQNT